MYSSFYDISLYKHRYFPPHNFTPFSGLCILRPIEEHSEFLLSQLSPDSPANESCLCDNVGNARFGDKVKIF
jgi:hypothetical protein